MSSRSKNGQTPQQTGIIADHTGLFVSWEKSHLLIRTIQDVLRTKYKTFAKIGIRLPNNTAEVILYSMQSSGANIPGAKHLLESYLKMIQETRSNVLIEKKVEVIELDVDESIPCIDLDDSRNESVTFPMNTEINGSNSQAEQSKISRRKVNGLSRNVSVKYQDKNSSGTEILNGSSSSSESNNGQKRLKRKHSFVDDVFEILDDEVIILDDSFSSETHKNLNRTNLNSNSCVEICDRLIDLTDNSVISAAESSNKSNEITSVSSNLHKISNGSYISNPSSPALCPQTSSKNDNKYETVQSTSTSAGNYERLIDLTETTSPLRSGTEYNKTNQINSSSSQRNFSKISNISSSPFHTQTAAKKECNSVTIESSKSSSGTFSNKVSKLKYKRPAHLMVPLTTSSNNSTVDSQSNIYNPHAGLEEKKTGLRPIVIDGNNVAIGHGKGVFSMKGLEICINFFEKRGHRQIKAFVPHYRTNRDTFEGLRRLEKQGTVVVTPSRKVDGKVVASYDDRFIVQYASEFEGVIVSSDNFRDLLTENPSWKETIEKRLLMFTWVDDLLMFPQDPLGRNGPSLVNFLKFPD